MLPVEMGMSGFFGVDWRYSKLGQTVFVLTNNFGNKKK
jgi:hypothetical protein